jgi:hypothetical protein
MVGVSLYHGSGFFFFTILKEEVILYDPTLRRSSAVDFTIGAAGSIIA